MSDKVIPYSIAKQYLSANGMRVKPDAVKCFQEYIRDFALEISKKVSAIVEGNKRKTITVGELNSVISITTDDDEYSND